MTRPMSEEREKLEPCPFCDRQMTLRPDGYYRHAFQRRGPLCVAEFVAVLAGDSVSAEKWNRRSTSSAERGMREALESARLALEAAKIWLFDDSGTPIADETTRVMVNDALAALSPKGEDEQARGQGGEKHEVVQ